MTIWLGTPGVEGLAGVVGRLGEWQSDGGVFQLHPGDLGWYWRFGAERAAAAVRVWERDGEVVAIGMLDEPDLLRLAFAPEALGDEELARRIVDDCSDPARGVLIEGKVYFEAPTGGVIQEILTKDGWQLDEPWQPLRRDLAEPVESAGLSIEVVGPETAGERAGLQQASFDGSTFTDERWHTMAAGTAYATARCLIGRDEQGTAVASITVWSISPGKPGLIEPMGVHRDHRGRGYGEAITRAGAAALRELGASSALVATPCSNIGAVATYEAAGFAPLPQTRDQIRDF
ncbi:GNAT family N-acetyltransferase [Streptomyces sp. SID13031]|uniref:GNAT family N-acetyltransferase n=1 Tax=Streptomyces sp. SID13031 TaxID=2706046 RepID=UPI0013CA94E9|nr:GNAT family N-acetyltransferase [Streptomyces sp. SID13031]NEA33037.1 GNAT family N-acetyltransferase [Streptomyces sp. SID13031]